MRDMFFFFFFNHLQHCQELVSLVVAPAGEHAASPPPSPSHSVCARQRSLQTRPRAFMNKALNITPFKHI